MAKQSINVGATANDKKGDSLRAAFQKVNANFTELYTALGLNSDGTLNLGAFEFVGSTMSTTDSTPIVIDQTTTISSDLTVGGDILPSVSNGSSLGSPSKPFKSLYVSTNTVYFNNIPLSLDSNNEIRINNIPLSQTNNVPTDVSNLTDTQGLLGGSADLGLLKISGTTIGTQDDPNTGGWGSYSLYLDPGGESSSYIQIPSVPGQTVGAELIIANNNIGNGGIRLSVNTGDYYIRDTGLELPNSHYIRQNNSWTRTVAPTVSVGAGSVVWTSNVDYISSAKLTIQVECDEVGDLTGWHSQACEAIISCRGYANTYGGPGGDPQMIVYGVVHTSVDPLVTFTVQRNPTTKFVEVVGTLTAAASGNAALRIHSVEMSTRD
jgi:hypothetical protein